MKYEKPWEGGGGGGWWPYHPTPTPVFIHPCHAQSSFFDSLENMYFSITLRYKFAVLPNVWIVHRYHTLSPLSFAHLTVSLSGWRISTFCLLVPSDCMKNRMWIILLSSCSHDFHSRIVFSLRGHYRSTTIYKHITPYNKTHWAPVLFPFKSLGSR